MRITERRIIFAAFCVALGASPAFASSNTVPSYQPYYYTPAEQQRMPVDASAQPSVEVYPEATAQPAPQPQLIVQPQAVATPIPTTVSAPAPAPTTTNNLNTVRNLNDELPVAMRAQASAPMPAPAPVQPLPTVISTSGQMDVTAPAMQPPVVSAAVPSMPMAPPLPQPGPPPAIQPVPLPAAVAPVPASPAPMVPKTNLNLNAPSVSPVTLDQLPSYQNTPDIDQHRTWTTPKAVDKPYDPDDQSSSNSGRNYDNKYFLNTPNGVDVAALFEGYHYQEPDAGGTSVNLNGLKYGLGVALTTHFNHELYGTAEVEYARGDSDYHGSGTHNNNPEQLTDIRALVGDDFVFYHSADFGSAFYTGLGYRQLYSDDRGLSTDGTTTFAGYRRENQMVYLPLGMKPRVAFDADSRLEMLLEGDVILRGYQTSWLGDAGGGDPTVHNKQEAGSGYALRTGIMYQTKSWAIGPYLTYWSINDSQQKIFDSPSSSCGGPVCVGTEPENHTIEYGIEAKYHFDAF